MLKKNESVLDRVIRVILGIAVLSLIFIYPDAGWRWWALLGLIPLVTGLVGTCLIYQMLGMSTNPDDR